MTTKIAGYLVFEAAEGFDFEQALCLKHDGRPPPGGVLDWCTNRKAPATLFATRRDARAAIARTTHYCKAFGIPQDCSSNSLPAAKDCYIKPVAS